jgi:hypothetical protein
MSMFIYVVMAFWAAIGLAFNTRLSFMMASALAPTGALFTFLALWTGSLWGKPTWGTWWVWDARLTSELLLLFLYFGFLGLQAAIDDARRADRACALLAVVGVVVQAGTMSLQGIVVAQQRGEIFGFGGIGNPYILTQFVGFALFMVASQAELTQPPFDMPVAESELVSGYMVEYTGFRFLFFFIGEFGTAFAFAALAATLFLGGWSLPWVHGAAADVLGPPVLIAKVLLVAFLMFWARFTYPRFREDQLQALAWKYLIPLSLVNILATGIFKVVF